MTEERRFHPLYNIYIYTSGSIFTFMPIAKVFRVIQLLTLVIFRRHDSKYGVWIDNEYIN